MMTRARPYPRRPLPTSASRVWPRLPAVDFTTFRAACRRRLGPTEFTPIDEAYRAAADRTDTWLDQHAEPVRIGPPTLDHLAVDLVGWLCDVQLGPVADSHAALIVLRGTQAALFSGGILLLWVPDALGPDPAGRLPATLTTRAVAAIGAIGRTEHAAAGWLSSSRR